MSALHDNPIPEIQDSISRTNDDILTVEQRRERYRTKLTNHQKNNGVRLKQFLLSKRRYFRSQDIVARRKRAEDIDLMCRYFNGDQYGQYNDIGVYEDRRREGDFAYAIPVLSGHVEQAFLQLLKVKPQFTVAANDNDDALAKHVAQMCEDLGVKELERVTEKTVHSELYNMLLAGESVIIVGWEPNKISPRKAKRPKYKTSKNALAARRECAKCYTELPADAKTCPTCGSTEVRESPEAESVHSVFSGYEEVELGENIVYVPHMLATQRDMSAVEPEDSTYFIEYSYLDKHVAEWLYQSEIEPSREGLPVEMLLRFDLERSSTQIDAIIGTARLAAPSRDGSFASGQNSTPSPGRKQPQERHFWDPAEYGQFICGVDETLPDGTVLPAGTVFGDAFPDGAFILFMGDSVMDIKPCVRRRKVSIVRYGRIAGTNSGAGLRKIMPLQDAENDNFNLNQVVKHTVGHPLTVIDGHYVNELPGAGNVLKVTRAGLDDVGKVVKQYPGQSMNNMDGTQTVIEGAMQFIAGTNTVGGMGQAGAPDMRAAGTATGIAAMQEQAAGRQSGPVDQRIKRDKELIVQLLENIQEYSTDEQKQDLAKQFGPDTASAFFQANLRQAITVKIKSNSDMPRSMALTQANYLAFGQAVAAVLPMSQQFPWITEFLGDLATSMGFPFSVGEGRNDRREAEYRLNVLVQIEAELKEAMPQLVTNSVEFATALHAELAKRCEPLIAIEDAQDPMAPEDAEIPRVFMQVHSSFMDVYKDALFGEKAKSWSDAYKLCVIQLWIDHYKADLQVTAIHAKMQAEAEQAMNPQPPQQPEPKEDPKAKVLGSVDYKVAPPEIRRQMEAELGYQPATPGSDIDLPGAETEPPPMDEGEKMDREHKQNLELKGAEFEAEETAKDNDLQRELVKQGHQQDHQLQIEREKRAQDAEQAERDRKLHKDVNSQNLQAQEKQARIASKKPASKK